MFGKLEETWPKLRTALVSEGGAVNPEDREWISLFAALQLA